MPTFEPEYMSISVDDFLSACSRREIKDIIAALVEDCYLPNYVNSVSNPEQSAPEQIFETALVKLHNNWNRLTVEEEATITKISNRL
jgi:hypothetical protein